LWTLAICVSSALMLTVLRSNRRAAWIAYALSLAAGLWAYSFFAQIIAVHALYAAFSFSDAARRRVGVFVAIAFATLAFLPWLAVLFTRAGTALVDTTWSATGISPVLYAGKALFNAGTMFFDLDYVWIAFVPLAVLLVSIALYACYATLRNAEPRTALFLVLLGAVSALSLIVPDIVFHQKRALQNRYLAPLWLAFEFATAFTLANGIRAPASRTRSVWTGVTILFLACGAASCAVASYARTWWLADSDKTLPAIALALDGVASPTLVYVENDVILLELLPLANANLSFQLNGRLDAAALGASARPYVIAKAGALRRSPFSRSLSRVALPVIFPPPPSPAVSALRRRAAAERGLAGIEGPDELFTLPAVTRRRR